MLITSVAIFLTCGWPVIYLSKRYVLKDSYRTVIKFRTMVKNAEQIVNRDTVAPEPHRLLNIVISDEVYTPLGKFLEKIHFTELPQLTQVLTGTLTLVGNRPMPQNMLDNARKSLPYIEERFCIPSGITGPAQLAGRENLLDKERLRLEITYSYLCQNHYSPLMDLHILFITTLTPLGLYANLSMESILAIMFKYTNKENRQRVEAKVEALMGA